ncbi:MAG: CRISPR-associated endonuclease Cas1 [Xanthomonadales bacterium]|nr:CRISPR-associated endonuclease Cas1 [Xanthomonadales bacterium]
MLPSALIPLAWTVTLRATAAVPLGLFPEARFTGLFKQLLNEHDDDARPALWWFSWPRLAETELPAGEDLQLTLYALPAAQTTAERLIHALQRLPDSAPKGAGRFQIGHNLEFASVHALGAASSLRAEIATEAALLQTHSQLRLCLRSPARWLRPDHRQRRDEDRYLHHERELSAEVLGQRLRESWLSLRRELGIERVDPPELGAEVAAAELFWTELRYRNTDGKEKVCGGLLGEVILSWPQGLSDTQAWWLALAQHLGAGQRRAFGYGQFAWETLDGESLKRESTPSYRCLQRLADPSRLQAAFDRASDIQADDPDLPDDRPDPRDLAREDWIQRTVQRWQHGLIEPKPLRPVSIPKPGGGLRSLSIPPFLDRVLQRALLDQLAHALDAHMSERSYGFRPGRSRMQARDRILRLYDAGLRYVVESDVADFFDSVDFWRVAVRLRAFLGKDPVIDQVLAFISAPAEVDGHIEPRLRGLPQGAPLSPLLSNLILDDLDHDLDHAGYQMVRYADDFVILAPDADSARAALNLAQQSLAEKGLRLKGEKSRITSFEEGFSFLGYRFAPGIAVDRRHDSPRIPDRALVEELADAPIEAADAFALPPNDLPAADDFGTVVVLARSDGTLAVSGGQLIGRWKDQPEQRWPIAPMAALVLLGRQRLTSGALQALMAAGTPVHVADGRGQWLGATTPWPAPDTIDLWIAQRQQCQNPVFALDCAKAIVAARVRHQREALRRRLSGTDAAIKALDKAQTQIECATDLDQLRGVEGAAARSYFDALRAFVPAELEFDGRVKRPPRDPFNALLSLGAVILHSHVDLVLRARGLLPTVGFYHQPHGRHATLASDLMEPVRHRVERVALSMVRRGQLHAADFQREPSGAVRMTVPAKRAYIEALEREFATPAKLTGGEQTGTLHEHLWQQATALALACRGKGQFAAIRYR